MSNEYTLKHKDISVAVVDMNCMEIKEIINKEEFPIGVYSDNLQLTDCLFQSWYKRRTIPNNRVFADKMQYVLGMDFSEASVLAMGISLTDTFWISPAENNLQWKDVNYYDNLFNDAV